MMEGYCWPGTAYLWHPNPHKEILSEMNLNVKQPSSVVDKKVPGEVEPENLVPPVFGFVNGVPEVLLPS